MQRLGVVGRIFDKGTLYGYEVLNLETNKTEIVTTNKLIKMLQEQKNIFTNVYYSNGIRGIGIELRKLPSKQLLNNQNVKQKVLTPTEFAKSLKEGLMAKYRSMLQEAEMNVIVKPINNVLDTSTYNATPINKFRVIFIDKNIDPVTQTKDTKHFALSFPWLDVDENAKVTGTNRVLLYATDDFELMDNLQDLQKFIESSSYYLTHQVQIGYNGLLLPLSCLINSYHEIKGKERVDYLSVQGYYYKDIVIFEKSEMTENNALQFVKKFNVELVY